MKKADDLLFELKRSRGCLLEYRNNIEQQLSEAQEKINIALGKDSTMGDNRLTEQDAVWHNYLLNIFIDISKNLELIGSAISQYENENDKGAVSLERTLLQ